MAIVPKRRVSKSRRDTRRANWKLKLPAIAKCSDCGSYKLIHRVCKQCGIYKGTKVLDLEA